VQNAQTFAADSGQNRREPADGLNAGSAAFRPRKAMLQTAEEATIPGDCLASRQVDAAMAALDHVLLRFAPSPVVPYQSVCLATAQKHPNDSSHYYQDDQVFHGHQRDLLLRYSIGRPSTNCKTKRDPA
jgi:hypothetical protein